MSSSLCHVITWPSRASFPSSLCISLCISDPLGPTAAQKTRRSAQDTAPHGQSYPIKAAPSYTNSCGCKRQLTINKGIDICEWSGCTHSVYARRLWVHLLAFVTTSATSPPVYQLEMRPGQSRHTQMYVIAYIKREQWPCWRGAERGRASQTERLHRIYQTPGRQYKCLRLSGGLCLSLLPMPPKTTTAVPSNFTGTPHLPSLHASPSI